MLKLLIVGDLAPYTQSYLKPRETWPSILGRILESWIDEESRVVTCDYGEKGVGESVERAGQLLESHKPDIMLLTVGLSDVSTGVDQLLEEVKRFAIKARQGGARPAVATHPPVTSRAVHTGLLSKEDYFVALQELEQHADAIRKLASEEGIVLADIYRFLAERPVLLKHVYDGVHLDDVAQAAVAPYVASRLLGPIGVNYPFTELKELVKVYSDGMHNAFTDIAFWKEEYWLSFRTGTRHFIRERDDGVITVVRSADLYRWSRVARLRVEGWDARDPKLLPWGSRLFLYTQCWSPSLRIHASFCFYTDDGASWQGPFKCGDYVFWRPHIYGGKAYVAAYRSGEKAEDWEVHLLESGDGVNWRYVATMARGDKVNETDIVFEDDKAWAFARREAGTRRLLMLESTPPFREWRSRELSRVVQGPAAIRLNGKTFVSGRFFVEKGVARTGLFLLCGDRLKLVFEFPSGGDCSYPGMLYRNGLLVMSYYSSHEGSGTGDAPSDIYLALLNLSKIAECF